MQLLWLLLSREAYPKCGEHEGGFESSIRDMIECIITIYFPMTPKYDVNRQLVNIDPTDLRSIKIFIPSIRKAVQMIQDRVQNYFRYSDRRDWIAPSMFSKSELGLTQFYQVHLLLKIIFCASIRTKTNFSKQECFKCLRTIWKRSDSWILADK